jgi:hypothetical protein
MLSLGGPDYIVSTSSAGAPEIDINIDTDGDGLSDKLENIYGTDINKKDTDGDGYSDGQEVYSGYNPKGPGKLPAITKY